MQSSSPRCNMRLRKHNTRAAAEEARQPKRARTTFEVFADLELCSLLKDNEVASVEVTCESLIKRWQTMPGEELQLYEDLVLSASTDELSK